MGSDCKTLIQAVQSNDHDAKIQYINLEITDFIFAEDGSAHHEGHVQMELTKMLCPAEKPSDDNHEHHEHHFAEEETKCKVEVEFISGKTSVFSGESFLQRHGYSAHRVPRDIFGITKKADEPVRRQSGYAYTWSRKDVSYFALDKGSAEKSLQEIFENDEKYVGNTAITRELMSNHQVFECEKDFRSEYSKAADGVISCNCNEVTGCNGGGEETMCLGYVATVVGSKCTCEDFTPDSTPEVTTGSPTKPTKMFHRYQSGRIPRSADQALFAPAAPTGPVTTGSITTGPVTTSASNAATTGSAVTTLQTVTIDTATGPSTSAGTTQPPSATSDASVTDDLDATGSPIETTSVVKDTTTAPGPNTTQDPNQPAVTTGATPIVDTTTAGNSGPDSTGKPDGPDSTGKPDGPDSTTKPEGPDSTGKPDGPDSTTKPDGPDSTGQPEVTSPGNTFDGFKYCMSPCEPGEKFNGKTEKCEKIPATTTTKAPVTTKADVISTKSL